MGRALGLQRRLEAEHPHGLTDADCDSLFTNDKPTIFAFDAYPWLIHRLTYGRTNHKNLHVRGDKELTSIRTRLWRQHHGQQAPPVEA